MNAIQHLIDYAVSKELIDECERIWATNAVLETLKCDELPDVEVEENASLSKTLDALTFDAYKRGVIAENSVAYRDYFFIQQLVIVLKSENTLNHVVVFLNLFLKLFDSVFGQLGACQNASKRAHKCPKQ